MEGVSDALHGQMERDGVSVPTNISTQPKLATNLVLYLEAYYELDTERHHGQALMRIPWSSIVHYADRHCLDEDEAVYFIRAMDDAHLADMRKKQPSHGGSQGPRTVVQRPPRPD
jgi:hypothetical protein